MKTILDSIIESKRQEVAQLKKKFTYSDFEKQPYFTRYCNSISKSIRLGNPGIIAEFKRKSPSAGDIALNANIREVVQRYTQLGASAISCLTDEPYFGGNIQDLIAIRSCTNLPILRKEFIIDELQLFEAKAAGADAILLIAEALTKEEALHLTIVAQSLGMEVIMEFHDLKELPKINDQVDVIGINNRNLKLQQTNLDTSRNLIDYLPSEKVLISESGIKTLDELHELSELGFHGALIGESLLKNLGNPRLLTKTQTA